MILAFIAQQGGSGAGGGIMGFLPFILILVIIYFLMLRPQMKRQKEQAAMINALQKNDEVVTSGGVHGRIVRINERDNTLQLQIARGVIITIERSSVGKMRSGKGAAADRQLPETRERADEPQKPDQKRQPSAKKPVESREGQAEKGVVATTPKKGDDQRSHHRRRPRRHSRWPRPQSKEQPPKPSSE